ncbi:MAG: hypothetical protein ACSLE6_16935 [Mycobacterium sp.]
MAQLGICAFGTLSHRAADDAKAEYRAALLLAHDARVAECMRAEYDRRYAHTVQRVSLLLAELRDGRPVTGEVRAAAAAELRQLRDLFAWDGQESDECEPPALQAIRSAIKRAEDRGVDVSTHIELQPEAFAVVDSMATAVVTALDDATRFARVVVAATAGTLTGSVVHGFDGSDVQPLPRDVDIVTLGDRRWVSATVDLGHAA